MPNTQVTYPRTEIVDQLDSLRAACDHYSQSQRTAIEAALIQRDDRLAEYAAEFDTLTNERNDALAQKAAADQEIVSLQAQVANLQQQLNDLNASIDLAQGQG